MNMTATGSPATIGDQRRIQQLREIDLPGYVLLPGDPDRVDIMASQWEDATVVTLPRAYKAATRVYRGVRVGAMSTAIGAPSLESVFTDLARLGVHTFIRVGTCGALHADIEPGSLIINDAAVRLDGTTNFYARPEFPATASYEATLALSDSASALGHPYRIGTGCTAGSFLTGQGRPSLNGFMSKHSETVLEEMAGLGVLNFEMEAASLLTFARIFGFRAGVVCSVIANRRTGVWSEGGGVAKACMTGVEALARLSKWDEGRGGHGKVPLTAAHVSTSA
ncbi:uridine phosphorylase [Aminobacter sp. Y103A]|uniref:nucleoside phosphorylase n=1 Tax=Aminobacter sp. Y103A TaxID=1870862 RepID=UPI002573E809|nr:nucleoside phosphorylase [Aminobacter sp. SS-2016]BBD40239.1 uridine phosphorylase [Aminobacter sp. SS-2016]